MLDSIARAEGKDKATLLREMIGQVIDSGNQREIKEVAREVVKKLREPVAYLKIPNEEQRAKAERRARDIVAIRIEREFKL